MSSTWYDTSNITDKKRDYIVEENVTWFRSDLIHATFSNMPRVGFEHMARCGHIAYKHMDMNAVRQKAQGLPEQCVPPAFIRLLPVDDL